MLGRRVSDPDAIESTRGSTPGLSLLPVETVLTGNKRTEAVTATTVGGVAFGAYAIHAGRTSVVGDVPAAPFATLSDGSSDGVSLPRIIGTYLHGALEHPAVCQEIFGIAPPEHPKRESYDRLADWFEQHAQNLDHRVWRRSKE
jgi:adenosylcobyric acid synthase